MRPIIAISGASSFTGLWIALELQKRGWDVRAHCAEQENEYAGVRGARIAFLRRHVPLTFGVRAEDGGMAAWARSAKPSIWIHHHHWMEKFREPDYDLETAHAVGIEPLAELVRVLSSTGCKGIIQSGSYFEPGEGGVAGAPTPYGESKMAVWESLRDHVAGTTLALSKVVIPDPVGPLENEDRLTPRLIAHARERRAFQLQTPGAIADRLPVLNLAWHYGRLADLLLDGADGGGETAEAAFAILRPSGWVGANRDWVTFVNRELIHARLDLPSCEIVESDDNSALSRHENPAAERERVEWSRVWDHYARFVRVADNGE